MVHKAILGKDLSRRVELLNLAQLRILVALVLAMLSEKGRLSKAQRKSLAITESQLGLRGAVRTEKAEIEGKEARVHKAKRHRHMTPAAKAALRKAIRANPRMSASAKRKAMRTLR